MVHAPVTPIGLNAATGVASREGVVDQRVLVERAGRGDHDAFAALVGATIARLEAVARLILRDPDLARDAVQEAYLRAWRDLPGLRDPDRFEAWLTRLLVNDCYEDYRPTRRHDAHVRTLRSTDMLAGTELTPPSATT